MPSIVFALVLLVFANVFIAFGVAFYWQAKVINTLDQDSDWNGAFAPWKGLSNPDSPQNKLGHFAAGDIHQELRRKWSRAVTYFVVSVLALILVMGYLQIFKPEYLS